MPSNTSSTQWLKVKCLALKFEPAGFDFADVQNLIDQFQEMTSVLKNVADEPVLLLIERAFQLLGKQLRETDDGVQRRAQFVAHAGQEFILEVIRLLNLKVTCFQLLIFRRQARQCIARERRVSGFLPACFP